jgi:glycosyltransferase involved in cell wall biosynthesis
VVIPTYKEATYVDRLLEALVKQKFKYFEVIVSDAESQDGIEKIVKNFTHQLDIKLVASPPQGPSHGRNIGAKAARGDWLLFLDADVDIHDPSFLEKLMHGTQSKGWKTSSGQLRVRGKSLLGRLGHNQAYMNFMAHTKHPIFQGYCMFTHHDVFEKLRGFNEKIRYGEDNDYATRSAKYGFGFVKDAYYYVDPRRYEQEGWSLLFKNMRHEIYRLTHGFSFEENKSTYEFGKHKKRTY